ncbi:conjugative transposon TraN protein [Flavobacterium sp. 90]|uniref:conjugative transposon protein TraN n=1 Tax=unclassified Flavobacterium TaxID=196869 RepID=UPI000EAF549A|nr:MULTISPECIES: conjugative transposon protein TraN [unclassified Flavobacterium]RKR05185.1 conjugative transposon TraN protein [Flavobacterium sp. 81]TCK56500.1 conjugative transposon TraN protein [Flavobacterium sp. 90]
MKNIKSWFTIGILIISIAGSAQENQIIKDNNVQLSYSKTTSILFPYAVKSVDRGSQDVLVQKAKGVENILLLKAGRQNFAQTNLTVITADGKLYGFVLNFDEQCPTLNLTAELSPNSDKDVLFSSENENLKEVQQYSQLALSKKKKVSGLVTSKFSIQLRLNGIFIHQDVIYFRVLLGNNSRINYDIDQLRFFIRDQKKSKRTASQELEILPIYATSNISKISDHSQLTLVFAIPKFTIPEKKLFTLQLIEKNGGRHVELNVKNSDLINLEILSNL